MKRSHAIATGFLCAAVVITVVVGIFVHFFVFPRTTVFQETEIKADDVVKINITRAGYSDNIAVTDPDLVSLISRRLEEFSITKAYRYEHQDKEPEPCYTYTFRTGEEGRLFSVDFYEDNSRILLTTYNVPNRSVTTWEYTIESFSKMDLLFFQDAVPKDKWVTKGVAWSVLPELFGDAEIEREYRPYL